MEESTNETSIEQPVAETQADEPNVFEEMAAEPAETDTVADTGAPPPVEQPAVAQPAAEQPARPPSVARPPRPAEPTIEQIAERRAAIKDEITRRYAIPEEDVALLQTEPEKVLPKMAAGIFVDVYEATLQAVYSMIPSLVQQQLASAESARSFRDEFFRRWPQLQTKPEYAEALNRTFSLYRQLNPKATRAQMINEVGMQAMLALGLPLTQPPAAPSQPQRPFVPAGPGAQAGAPAGTQQQRPMNIFEEMAAEMERI